MSSIVGSLNSLIWLLVVIVVIAVVVWAVRTALAPRVDRPVAGPPEPSRSLAPGWYPDQNDHRMMRYYDGRVWTSETRSA